METARGVGVVPGASHQRRRPTDRTSRPSVLLSLGQYQAGSRREGWSTSAYGAHATLLRHTYISWPKRIIVGKPTNLVDHRATTFARLTDEFSTDDADVCRADSRPWLVCNVRGSPPVELSTGLDEKNGAYAEPREPDRSRNKRTLDGRRRGVTFLESGNRTGRDSLATTGTRNFRCSRKYSRHSAVDRGGARGYRAKIPVTCLCIFVCLLGEKIEDTIRKRERERENSRRRVPPVRVTTRVGYSARKRRSVCVREWSWQVLLLLLLQLRTVRGESARVNVCIRRRSRSCQVVDDEISRNPRHTGCSRSNDSLSVVRSLVTLRGNVG